MTTELGPSHDDLIVEQVANARYQGLLKERSSSPLVIDVPANTNMAGNLRAPLPDVRGALLGRVGRAGGDPNDPVSFYIGPRYSDRDGLTVYSWAAPVAKVFFETASCSHEFARHVVVVRTLTSRLESVVAIDDDWIRAHEGPSPFASTADLRVPTPTRRPSRKVRAAAPGRISPPPEAADTVATQPPASGTGLRAERAVRRALRAPRTGVLSPVLATLQPDQFEVVSRRPDEHLIVQGHPGTGKTVVAVHRSAYLVHPDNEQRRPRRILLLGPTRDWVRHVQPLLGQLLAQAGLGPVVEVRDVAGWLADIAGLSSAPAGTPDGLSDEVEHRLAGLATKAAANMAARNRWNPAEGSRAKKVRAVYEELRDLAQQEPEFGEKAALLAALRPWDNAIHDRRLLPVLAQCAIALLEGSTALHEYDHVLVDEAQDVTRIEWMIVDRLNRGGQWTLVGDMNQRRTDRTHLTWDALAADLGIVGLAPRVLGQGFRSTQQILDFAAHVLPRGEPRFRSLQSGPPVTVQRVAAAGRLGETAIAHAERLIVSHRGGTVAIYSERASSLIPALVAGGWRKVNADSTIQWQREDERLSLHTPISGRGIEFDAVVVMEPADFNTNLDRSGPMYTTLTRANRELAVVHHAALPPSLARVRG